MGKIRLVRYTEHGNENSYSIDCEFFFYFEQLLICLIKQQKTLGAVIAEYEADNGDRRRGNVDE